MPSSLRFVALVDIDYPVASTRTVNFHGFLVLLLMLLSDGFAEGLIVSQAEFTADRCDSVGDWSQLIK